MVDYLTVSIIILQVVNITVSAVMPCLSNFSQSITQSDCCGLKIRRKVDEQLKKIKSTHNIKDDLKIDDKR